MLKDFLPKNLRHVFKRGCSGSERNETPWHHDRLGWQRWGLSADWKARKERAELTAPSVLQSPRCGVRAYLDGIRESCPGQAVYSDHRFRVPGATMAAVSSQQMPGWGLHPNKPAVAETGKACHWPERGAGARRHQPVTAVRGRCRFVQATNCKTHQEFWAELVARAVKNRLCCPTWIALATCLIQQPTKQHVCCLAACFGIWPDPMLCGGLPTPAVWVDPDGVNGS